MSAVPVHIEPTISRSLADKLALMLWYLDETMSQRRGHDDSSFYAMLDDPEIAAFLMAMKKADRIHNTRFTHRK